MVFDIETTDGSVPKIGNKKILARLNITQGKWREIATITIDYLSELAELQAEVVSPLIIDFYNTPADNGAVGKIEVYNTWRE